MGLGERAVRGAAWNIGLTLGSRLIALAGTLLITRYISPKVAGEVNVAFTLVAMSALLSNVGFTQYIMTRRDGNHDGIFHAGVLHIVLGFVGFGLVVLAGPMLTPHFGSAAAASYMPWLAVAMFLERIGQVPERSLARELRMRPVGMARGIGELAYSGSSILLAMNDFGGASIVWGNVVRNVVYLAIILSASGMSWARPVTWSHDRVREIFRFGTPLYLAGVAYWSARRTDNLLFARMFGEGPLGHYNLAYNLADIPATHVGEHLGEVLLPAMSQMEKPQRIDALLRGTVLICLLMFPLAVGVGMVGPTAVYAMFTPEWWPVAPLVSVLSVLSVTRPIHWTVGNYMDACGLTKTHLYQNVPHLFTSLGAMWLFGQYGPIWACVGVGVAYALLSLAAAVTVKIIDGIPLSRFLGGLVPPLLACAPMAGAIYGVRQLLAGVGYGPSLFTLAVEILVGALVYVPSALVIAPSASREFLRLVRSALGRQRREA